MEEAFRSPHKMCIGTFLPCTVISPRSITVLGVGIEPTCLTAADFKSTTYTSSVTRAISSNQFLATSN